MEFFSPSDAKQIPEAEEKSVALQEVSFIKVYEEICTKYY